MATIWVHGILVILVSLSSGHAHGCPSKCRCQGNGDVKRVSTVACIGVQLRALPADVPATAVTLNLSRNAISTLTKPADLDLSNIVNFNLSQNQIRTIGEGMFSSMRALVSLDLSGNQLVSLDYGSFMGSGQGLRELDLYGNQLTSVDGAFAGMANLDRLDLRENQLEEITEFMFRDQVNLRFLFLTGNRIQSVDRHAFRYLEKLFQLVLKGNPIRQVARFHFFSTSLSYLDLSECGLTQVPRGLTDTVRYLQMRRNNLTDLKRETFVDATKIDTLILDENQIHRIEDDTFSRMAHLQQLWLNDNHLETIPRPLPPSLLRLLLESNRIREVTNVFPSRSQMNTMSLVGNQISKLSHDAFGRLTKLKNLDLSNNRIPRIYSQTFANNSELASLGLNKNPLRYFQDKCFHGLISLRFLSLGYIDSDPIHLNPDLFSPLTSLVKLDMDNSPGLVLAVVSSDATLTSIGHIRELGLLGSNLLSLRSDFPRFFQRLTLLRISSARWHCDRSLLWFRDWMRVDKVRVEDPDDNRCFTPRSLHGRPIAMLADADFVPVLPTLTPPTSQPRQRDDEESHEEALTETQIPPLDEDYNEPEVDNTVEELPAMPENMDYPVDQPMVEVKTPKSTSSPSSRTSIAIEKEPEVDKKFALNEISLPPTVDRFSTSAQLQPPVDRETKKHFRHPEVKHKPTTRSDIYRSSSSVEPEVDSFLTGSPYSDKEVNDDANITIIIAVLIVVTTVVVAAFIVALIIFTWNRKRKVNMESANRTIIQYKNKDGVLFFSTAGGRSETGNGVKDDDVYDSARALSGSDVIKSNSDNGSRTRMYKWEES